MDKALQLHKAKRQAGGWLLAAAGMFIGLTVWQTVQPEMAGSTMIGLLKMMSEAALVGGLADWFAVSALFRPIPAFKPIPHTNIVARNQQAIADNLAQFVKEKFFHEQAIEALVARSAPAKALGLWLTEANNARRLSQYVADSLKGLLNVVYDEPIQQALRRSVERGLRKLPLAALLAGSLRLMTKDGRHQQLVNKLIDKLAAALQSEASQAVIADKLNGWLKTEYRRLEKILPSAWLSEQGAGIAVSAISHTLQDINDDPQHPVRLALNTQIERFIDDLESDEATAQKLDAFRNRLLESEALHQYLQRIWLDIHQWLMNDLAQPQGQVVTRLTVLFNDSGERLLADSTLQQAVNYHMGVAARYIAPELADFLTDHIRRTILGWDSAQMSRQIELNIGKDLQKVRINGTLVGGLIGGILFGLEYAIGQLM
ncbi:DUF445 domain-containing protein [Alteromonas lipolytica]|uniref:DUF445 domain-containing protein n=1 Tax=Alteromonas lipolytica TaxID=1856405 RepID=A0A1E8FG98_9ALTE|nr:DUF445 family protein [Alteromonas lipolytica]OFI34944.1 hypothetical protein BFC17_15375 [Alteromonas lipolytica]GGF55297.1 membrane protein [Alteromonas lipolytica]